MRLSADVSSSRNFLPSVNKYSTTPDTPPASSGRYAAPMRDDDPAMPRGLRDAPPSKEGWYAAPATTGCDDDLFLPRDAPPASKGRYDTAATTAREHLQRRAIDVLRMLRLTLNKTVCPRRIVEHPSDAQHKYSRFAFTQDYLHHLASIMTLSSDLLNEFLQAAGSDRTFTYGASKFYDGKTFKETLSHEWPIQTLASSFETRLLKRIATVSEALKCYVAEPPGQVKTDSLQGIDCTIASPMREDALWARDVMEAVQATLELACCENDEDKPPALASTTASSRPPRGRSPVTVATPATASAGPDASNANTSHKAAIASVSVNAPTRSYDLESSSFGLPRSSSDEMPQVSRTEQPPIGSHEIATTSLQHNYLATSRSTQHQTPALPVQNTDRLVPSSARYAQAVSVNRVTAAASTTASSNRKDTSRVRDVTEQVQATLDLALYENDDEQWLKHSGDQGDPNSWHTIRPLRDPDKVCTTESAPGRFQHLQRHTPACPALDFDLMASPTSMCLPTRYSAPTMALQSSPSSILQDVMPIRLVGDVPAARADCYHLTSISTLDCPLRATSSHLTLTEVMRTTPVMEPMVPDLRLLSSARLCTFPIVLPSFSLNSLFRPNEANISYVYILVYLSIYNTPVFASWFRSSSFSFSLSLSLLLSLVLRLPGALKEPCPALGTKLFLS